MPKPATEPELHARRLKYRRQAGIPLLVLLVLGVMSVLPTDDEDEGTLAARVMFFGLLTIFCGIFFIFTVFEWMGCMGQPNSKQPNRMDSPLRPLYWFVPFAALFIIAFLPGPARRIVSYILIAVDLLAFVAGIVRCYKFETAYDFTVAPEEDTVELLDTDNAEARAGSSDLSESTLAELAAPGRTGKPEDEERLLGMGR